MIRIADSADRKMNITFGFQQRYGPVYLNAKKMIDSGAIGKIREVHAQFLKYGLKGDEPALPAPSTEAEKMEQWKLWRATYGDIIVETYCRTAGNLHHASNIARSNHGGTIIDATNGQIGNSKI